MIATSTIVALVTAGVACTLGESLLVVLNRGDLASILKFMVIGSMVAAAAGIFLDAARAIKGLG